MLWFVLLLGVGSAVSDASEPYFTGRIEQDTTWRGMVYVGGDVTIAAAATLTLAPNTQVLFLPYRDETRGGLDTTRAELIVEGRLAAHAGGIVFRSADAGSWGADWYGLVVERGGRADVSHAVIRDGLRCVYAKMGGFVRMDAIAFANCGKPTAPADAAKQATPRGRERKEELGLFINATPSRNQPSERQEITIHISGEHTAVVAAVLAAVDAGTTVTGIAELDSLAATYGLIGIYRKGRMSPLYGYYFRLTFPPTTDIASVARAYGNLSYIRFVESDSKPDAHFWKMDRQRANWGERVVGKLLVGTLVGSAVLVGVGVPLRTLTSDRVASIAWVGYPIGVGIGTSLWDRHHYYRSLVFSIGGSLLGAGIGFALIPTPIYPWVDPIGAFGTIGDIMIVSSITATLASELFRKPPESGRFSVGLVPDARGNWSARATLRF